MANIEHQSGLKIMVAYSFLEEEFVIDACLLNFLEEIVFYVVTSILELHVFGKPTRLLLLVCLNIQVF